MGANLTLVMYRRAYKDKDRLGKNLYKEYESVGQADMIQTSGREPLSHA